MPEGKQEEMRVTHGSGNVFADLGLPNPEELLYKSKLVVAIQDLMKDLRLNQSAAAKLMGVSQPDLSKLLRGRTMSFTVDRLYLMLTQLGADIEITVVRRRTPTLERGEVRVREAVVA
jgi:predicted XRE-type DNA-binding protein